MSTWSTRIKSRMKELGLTQEVLANKLGITRGAVTHYLSGRRVPPLRQFQKLAAILKTDPAWLQFGKSPETKLPHLNLTKKEKVEKAQSPIPIYSWEQVSEFVISIKEPHEGIKESVKHFYTDKVRWYALRIKGDAMTTPLSHGKSFHEGDVIIVDPEKKAIHNSYVIAILPHAKEATFKQYVIDGGVRYLKPLNPQYPITKIDDSTHICGVIVSCISQF